MKVVALTPDYPPKDEGEYTRLMYFDMMEME